MTHDMRPVIVLTGASHGSPDGRGIVPIQFVLPLASVRQGLSAIHHVARVNNGNREGAGSLQSPMQVL
jgi:hypothetical protein